MPIAGPGLTSGMTTVGFIGSGRIGGTVARLAVAAGYDVVLSNSGGPQTLRDLVDELGPRARAATAAEAAAAGDLVVVSIPPRAYPEVPVQPVAGKPVLDTINYIPQRDGRIPGMDDGSLSSSEVLQRHLGTAHVVKVFNNIFVKHLASLARPAGAADRSALPIAGDDPAAKAAVTGFLDAIGYDTVDAGPLGSGGRRFQFGTRAFVAPYGTLTDQLGITTDAAALRTALGA
jgi:8-hydroxy-5-deazaflavin:NADPH oxidoreductase